MTEVVISKRLVLINAASSVATRVLSVGVLVWVNQHLIKRLDAEDYALYPVIAAIVLFAQVLMSLFTGGVARYITAEVAKGNAPGVTVITSTMMPMILGCAVMISALGAAAVWQIDSLLEVYPAQLYDARFMMGLLLANQVFALITLPFTVGLHVRQKFVWLNLIQLGQELFRLGILCFLLYGVSTRVLWVVVATVIATPVGTLLTTFLSRRVLPELRWERSAFDWSIGREILGFGGWTMIGNLVYRIRTSADAIILNKFGTAVDVTAYHVASLPDRQMSTFVTMASGVLQPVLTAMHATERIDSLQRTYLRGNRYYLWIALAVAVPLIVYSKELVVLYVTETYIAAATAAMILYATYPFIYASDLLYRVAVATARVRQFFIVTIGGSIGKIALSIWFIGGLEMGAVGAALSTFVIGVLAQTLLLWPLGLAMLKLPFRTYLRETLLPGYFPAAATALFCYGFKNVVSAESWSTMALNVGLGMIVYCAIVLLTLRDIDKQDLAVILVSIRRKFRRADKGLESKR